MHKEVKKTHVLLPDYSQQRKCRYISGVRVLSILILGVGGGRGFSGPKG